MQRKMSTLNRLRSHGYISHRISAYSVEKVSVPPEAVIKECLVKQHVKCNGNCPKGIEEMTPSQAEILHPQSFAHVIELCSRPVNTPVELTCALSHLKAIRTAVHPKIHQSQQSGRRRRTSNKLYAVIMEDDVSIDFDIDFDALVASAPSDWGILQLQVSKFNLLRWIFTDYYLVQHKLWIERSIKELDFWSMGVYIINKQIFKEVMDKISRQRDDGSTEFRLVSGYRSPCFPSKCCTSTGQFNNTLPCVHSPWGISSDMMIYQLAKTYVLTVPLFNGIVETNSSLHVNLMSVVQPTFDYISIVQEFMKNGTYPLPSFAKVCQQSVYIINMYHL